MLRSDYMYGFMLLPGRRMLCKIERAQAPKIWAIILMVVFWLTEILCKVQWTNWGLNYSFKCCNTTGNIKWSQSHLRHACTVFGQHNIIMAHVYNKFQSIQLLVHVITSCSWGVNEEWLHNIHHRQGSLIHNNSNRICMFWIRTIVDSYRN